MSLIAKEPEKKAELVPEDIYLAKCISVIDLGKSESEYDGKKNIREQVLLEFEVPEIVIEFEKDGEKKKFNKVLRKFYTNSLSEKASLRADLNRWRKRAFTEEELKGFNLSKVLGVDCQLQVIHETKDGKTRQKVEVLPAVKGQAPIEVENELTLFDFDFPDYLEKIEQLPEWIQDKLKNSITYEDKRVEKIRQEHEARQVDGEDVNPDEYEEIPWGQTSES
jgi:hypothetical protein